MVIGVFKVNLIGSWEKEKFPLPLIVYGWRGLHKVEHIALPESRLPNLFGCFVLWTGYHGIYVKWMRPYLFCFATNVYTGVTQFGMEFLSERIQLILTERILAARHMLSI